MNHGNISEENDHHIRELEQKIEILSALENDLTDKVKRLQKLNEQLQEKLSLKSLYSKEATQEKLIQKEMLKKGTNTSDELKVTKQNLKESITLLYDGGKSSQVVCRI